MFFQVQRTWIVFEQSRFFIVINRSCFFSPLVVNVSLNTVTLKRNCQRYLMAKRIRTSTTIISPMKNELTFIPSLCLSLTETLNNFKRVEKAYMNMGIGNMYTIVQNYW